MDRFLKYFIIIFSFLFSQETCLETDKKLSKWLTDLKKIYHDKGIKLTQYNEDYKKFTEYLKSIERNCNQELDKNRYKVKLYYFFSQFCAGPQGDLSTYQNILNSAKDLDRLIRNNSEFSNNLTWVKNYIANYADIEEKLDDIKEKYKDLRIYIKNPNSNDKLRMNKITKVINRETKSSIGISLTPPPNKLNNPRMVYLKSSLMNQDFILDKYDSNNINNGFYFDIRLLPIVDDPNDVDIENTYSITFDDKYRFHIPNIIFDAEEDYVEFTIPKINEWEEEESLPDRYIKLVIPREKRALNWWIKDESGSPYNENNIKNTGLIFVKNQKEGKSEVDVIYIDTQLFKVENPKLIFGDDKDSKLKNTIYKYLSHSLILILIVGIIL